MLPLASIENVVFHVSNVLRTPVLIVALVAVALVVVECGALGVELVRRGRRNPDRLQNAATHAREAIVEGDRASAAKYLGIAVSSAAMWKAVLRVVALTGLPEASIRVPKTIADFDIGSLRRLERTRVLVRVGPALGLMGTLIPLSPALSGLASGKVDQLTSNLRVAFSVTVLGLLVGAVAFGISLVRDRLYAQDLSDLTFIAATLEGEASA
ncbi:MAG TPA: MotA/TolQ/ExbB proton channel family protein [Solirubrobacteraceae bacterium]|jgi:biopolymer transport protein ExbB/TolQ